MKSKKVAMRHDVKRERVIVLKVYLVSSDRIDTVCLYRPFFSLFFM